MKNLSLSALLVHLKLYALEAVTSVEAKARDVLAVEGEKLLEKRAQAVAFGMERYRVLTLDVPIVNATDVDDAWVQARLEELVDEAFGWLGDQLNSISRVPVVDDQDVPVPTVTVES